MAKSNIASSQDRVYDGSSSIDNQTGFYNETNQNTVSDCNSRAGQMPAAPDDRFTNVIGTLKD